LVAGSCVPYCAVVSEIEEVKGEPAFSAVLSMRTILAVEVASKVKIIVLLP
jgi:hypothetical protein